MLQIQESSSDEEKIYALSIEYNVDPELTQMRNEDYGMINHPINVVQNLAIEAEVQGNSLFKFENTIQENNLPAHQQQGFIVDVNEDSHAYSDLSQ